MCNLSRDTVVVLPAQYLANFSLTRLHVVMMEHLGRLQINPGAKRQETSLAIRRVIIELHKNNILPIEISRKLNISRTTVFRWIKRFNEEENLQNQPRKGRPRCTTREQDEQIVAKVISQPITTAAKVNQELGLQISNVTVRRRLHNQGIHHRRPAIKPSLSQNHQEQRVAFALQYLPFESGFWDNVIWCDEKTFASDDHGILHCWRPNKAR